MVRFIKTPLEVQIKFGITVKLAGRHIMMSIRYLPCGTKSGGNGNEKMQILRNTFVSSNVSDNTYRLRRKFH